MGPIEKFWGWMATFAAAAFLVLGLTAAIFGAFSDGQTDYCKFSKEDSRLPVTVVVQHRSFSTSYTYSAPTFDEAMEYAEKVCPNFKK